MIPLDPLDHRHLYHKALVDGNGNIIMPAGEPLEHEVSREKPILRTSSSLWTITDEDGAERIPEKRTEELRERYSAMQEVFSGVRTGFIRTTELLLEESASQYGESYRGAREASGILLGSAKRGARHLWTFLTQPVWILQKNREPKKLSRISLFTLDVVRFGGTFAAIFVALFLSLNFQSFWKIVTPHIDPLELRTGASAMADSAMKEKLMKIPGLAIAGRGDGDLLSYLPEVGPPENRLIIAKLGINVPLVTPSYNSLLQEDWAGVEEDIQDALQHGVVHYPGTARPGQAGNFFTTGHSSYYPFAPGHFKTVFARLHELDVGDEYWVYYGGDSHRYIVQGKKEVKPNDVSVLDQPTGKRIGTLMTCTPVGTTLRRLVVIAQEVDPVTGIALEVGEHGTRTVSDFKLEALPI